MSTGTTKSLTHPHAKDHPLVRSAAIMAQTMRLPTMIRALSRDASSIVTTKPDTQASTDKFAPVVIFNDLTVKAGSEVEIILHHEIEGEPIMGTEHAEGRGSLRTKSTDSVKIDRYTKPVKDGDVYDIQERGHELKKFNESDLGKYYQRFADQSLIFHLAGARGHYMASDIHVPLETSPSYKKIMVNPVNPPTNYRSGSHDDDALYSRHFFANGKNCISGLDRPLTANDRPRLADIKRLNYLLEEMPNPPMKIDLSPKENPNQFDPIYAMYMPPRSWFEMQQAEDTTEFNKLMAMAFQRAELMAGGKMVHPLFSGQCLLVGNILVRKMPYPVRFLPGYKVPMANPESKALEIMMQSVPVNDEYCVERSILLGGQALAMAFGNAASKAKKLNNPDLSVATNFRILGADYDYGRKSETAAEWVEGKKKITFSNGDGIDQDRGVIAFDCAVRLKAE